MDTCNTVQGWVKQQFGFRFREQEDMVNNFAGFYEEIPGQGAHGQYFCLHHKSAHQPYFLAYLYFSVVVLPSSHQAILHRCVQQNAAKTK